VETALTSLALNPKIAILLLFNLQVKFSFNVNFLYIRHAVVADCFLVALQQIFTAKACWLYLSKGEKTSLITALWRNIDVARVFTTEESHFDVFENWLK
jgi:hypothetical protein